MTGRLRDAVVSVARYAVRAGRARRILLSYRDHHAAARAAYVAAGHGDERIAASPDRVGVRVVAPGSGDAFLALPVTHAAAIARVARSLNGLLALSGSCWFLPAVDRATMPEATSEVPAVKDGRVLALQLRDWRSIDGLADLARPLVAAVARAAYGSWAIVDKVYAYRNLPCSTPDLVSWKWHYDNHPSEVLKIMIYLTDVGPDDGAFEYLARSAGGDATPIAPLPNARDSRVRPRAFARWLARGYAPRKALGPAGTVVLFDSNVVHRATRPITGRRDVVVLQIRPADFAPVDPLDERWTGSFQHDDCNDDPSDYRAVPKGRMYSG